MATSADMGFDGKRGAGKPMALVPIPDLKLPSGFAAMPRELQVGGTRIL
jgi:hypothetical protein